MKIEIKEKKQNKLLSRTEISGIINFDNATPSNEEVAKQIAKQMNISENNIKLKQILTRFGEKAADFRAFVYETPEKLEEIEPQPKKWLEKQKKKLDAKKKQETTKSSKEEPKQEKKEEKPEEKKESKSKQIEIEKPNEAK